jgi:hypothetical protein
MRWSIIAIKVSIERGEAWLDAAISQYKLNYDQKCMYEASELSVVLSAAEPLQKCLNSRLQDVVY